MNSQSVQSPHHFSNLPPALHQQQQPHGSNMASPSPSSSSTPSSPSSSQHHHHQHYIQLQQSYLDFAAAHHHHHQHPHQQQSSPSSYPNAHQQQQQQQQQQPQPGQQSHPSSKVNSELIVQHPDLFIQQQYEQKIRALQMEIQAMKQAMLCFNHGNSNCNNTPNPSNHNLPKKSSTRSSTNHNNDQQHIVETYCEEICIKEFSCKNCSYKTKSEASLIIHNTNHLVSQRYLHLPTTVFSTKASQEQASAHTFLYPCGECTGKYSHNDLYLHIYQHHTGENPFHCDECNLFFMHYEFLDHHQRTEHMKSENHYQQKNKKSRYYDPNNMSPHLTYYSVVKCSKPFTSFVPINTVGRQSNSAWNNQPASNNQPAFPYVTKRGRGRASHHSVGNRTSSFQNLLQTTASVRAQSSSKTVSNNNNNRGSDMQFKCHYEDCFFAADSQERLDFHLFAHRNSRFKCPYCPYVSNVLNDIKRHCIKGQKHDGLMFTCPNCDHMQTNCDKTFKDHIRNVHFNKMIDDKMLQNFIEDLFLNNTSNPSQPTVTHP